ncbi:hypothetical protein WICPIJ_004407 [Wickerhamomyces pijperi]|uniref:Uncharacterized protein n=1 Tax=Wickerhamomyces pijperi TaxID=599730 RepID=A0A9P8TMY0_WICPI|nr:hypothetical protein WICPIJ_004407 [Wickerhamomyces pijperi]
MTQKSPVVDEISMQSNRKAIVQTRISTAPESAKAKSKSKTFPLIGDDGIRSTALSRSVSPYDQHNDTEIAASPVKLNPNQSVQIFSSDEEEQLEDEVPNSETTSKFTTGPKMQHTPILNRSNTKTLNTPEMVPLNIDTRGPLRKGTPMRPTSATSSTFNKSTIGAYGKLNSRSQISESLNNTLEDDEFEEDEDKTGANDTLSSDIPDDLRSPEFRRQEPLKKSTVSLSDINHTENSRTNLSYHTKDLSKEPSGTNSGNVASSPPPKFNLQASKTQKSGTNRSTRSNSPRRTSPLRNILLERSPVTTANVSTATDAETGKDPASLLTTGHLNKVEPLYPTIEPHSKIDHSTKAPELLSDDEELEERNDDFVNQMQRSPSASRTGSDTPEKRLSSDQDEFEPPEDQYENSDPEGEEEDARKHNEQQQENQFESHFSPQRRVMVQNFVNTLNNLDSGELSIPRNKDTVTSNASIQIHEPTEGTSIRDELEEQFESSDDELPSPPIFHEDSFAQISHSRHQRTPPNTKTLLAKTKESIERSNRRKTASLEPAALSMSPAFRSSLVDHPQENIFQSRRRNISGSNKHTANSKPTTSQNPITSQLIEESLHDDVPLDTSSIMKEYDSSNRILESPIATPHPSTSSKRPLESEPVNEPQRKKSRTKVLKLGPYDNWTSHQWSLFKNLYRKYSKQGRNLLVFNNTKYLEMLRIYNDDDLLMKIEFWELCLSEGTVKF